MKLAIVKSVSCTPFFNQSTKKVETFKNEVVKQYEGQEVKLSSVLSDLTSLKAERATLSVRGADAETVEMIKSNVPSGYTYSPSKSNPENGLLHVSAKSVTKLVW